MVRTQRPRVWMRAGWEDGREEQEGGAGAFGGSHLGAIVDRVQAREPAATPAGAVDSLRVRLPRFGFRAREGNEVALAADAFCHRQAIGERQRIMPD
ncbi:hypothetical protein, partial [Sphingomonas sp.]|uniref:hypothetical protein n=1 Tax=Sphingomonas sp. TaxID=28214 RepID=UPI002DB77AE7